MGTITSRESCATVFQGERSCITEFTTSQLLLRKHPDKVVKCQIKEVKVRCERHSLIVRNKLRRHYDTLHLGESPPLSLIAKRRWTDTPERNE